MAKLSVTTTSIADDIVDEEKPMSDVVNADFDKGSYEEKFVPDVVMALEAKTSELENTKETKIGESTELMQGEVEFVEKNGSLVTIDTKKIEMRVVEVTKGAVDDRLGELDTTVGRITTEGVMAATSMVSNVELEVAEKVQGGGTDEVEFEEDDCKSGCLTLVEATNTKEKATVASETTKGQVEAVYDSELMEGDLEDKHDDMVVAVSQVGSIKVPMAKDADDVVVEGQDDVLEAHIRKPRIGHSHLETYEVLEDEAAIMLCGVDEKHGGTDPAEVMIAVDGKLAKNSESLVEGEFLMKNAPWVPLPLVQTMDNALGEVEQIGGTLQTKDSELQTAAYTKLHRFGELDATSSELRIAAATTVEGEFAQDGVETRVAKSSKKDACLDSLDVLVEADIMLDQGEKNRDVMNIKNEEVMLAEGGEMSNDSRPTLESEFVDENITLVSLEATNFELEATFGKVEDIGSTLEQEDDQVVTFVVMDLAQDCLMAVKDKSVKESTSLATPDILEKEVKLTICKEVEIDVPPRPMHGEATLSDEQASVKNWKATAESDFFDEDVSLLSLHEPKSELEASSGEVDKMNATCGENDTQAKAKAFGEVVQDVTAARVVEPSMEHTYVAFQHTPKGKASITLGGVGEKDDDIGFKCLGVVHTVAEELVVDSRATIKDELHKEDAPLVPLHSLQMDLDPIVEEKEETGAIHVEKVSEVANTIDTKLYEADRIDATLVECVATNIVEGDFAQDRSQMTVAKSGKKDEYVDSYDAKVESEIILGQNDKNYNAIKAKYDEALLAEQGEMEKGTVVVVDSEFVADNFLASTDARKVELDVSLDDVKVIGAMMEQECSQVVIPQDGLTIVEVVSIEGSASLSTQKDLQSKEKLGQIKGEEKHFPTKMELVEELHMAQEGNMIIKSTSLVSPRASECEVETISGEVDGMNALSKDTWRLTKNDNVIQDVLGAHVVDTTSGEVDNAIRNLDEMEATSAVEKSQTLTEVAVEDTQDVMVTCVMESTMGYTYLGGEKEKETSMETKFSKAVEAEGKLAIDLHVSTVMEDAPFIPLHSQEINSDPSLGKVEEIETTLEAKESESMVVVHTKLDQLKEVDVTLVELRSNTSITVEGEFTQDVLEIVAPESRKKDRCFESTDLQEDIELVLFHEDKKCDTMAAMFEDVVHTVEGKLERDLQGKLDNDFVIEDAPSVCIHSSQIDLDATLEEEEEIGASLTEKDSEVTTAIDAKLYEVSRIVATLVECVATTRGDGEFSQDGLEMTVAKSRKKDEYVDSSDVIVEPEIILGQNDENYKAKKAISEEALLTEEGKMVKGLVVAVDSEFVTDNLLVSPDATKVELDFSLEDVKDIGAMMEQQCSQVMIPQDKLIIVENAPIEGSTSLSTQNVLQSKQMSTPGDGEEKHFLKVTTNDDATVPTKMELVEDWHLAQERNIFIECTSLGSLRAPKVDGMNAISNYTCTLNESDQEVTQDVLAAQRVDTTSGGVDNAISELDEIEPTSKAKESQTLTQEAVEDTQDVLMTCAMEPSIGYTILSTHDVLEVEAIMMLGGEEEKDIRADPNFAKVIVDAGAKVATNLHAWAVMEEAPCIPLHTQEIDSDASLGEVEKIVAPFEAKECESLVAVNTNLDQPQEADATLVELCNTESTAVEGKFTQDESEIVVPKSSKTDTCFKSSHMLEADFILVHEDTKYDTTEAMFEVVASKVEGKPEGDLQGKFDSEFVNENAPLVREHSSEMDLDATVEEEMELAACLVKNDSETTTAFDTKLYQVDRIDDTLVEYTTTTRVEGEFAQDGLEMIVAKLGSKDKSADFSEVMEEAEIVLGQNDENYNAMKPKYEEALLAEEDEMVKDPTVVVDGDFIVDNLLASSDTMKVELDISLENGIEIGATMEQGCSQVLIPKDGLIKVQDASIEGSTSLTTQNVLQSKEMSTPGAGEEQYFFNVATKDDATLTKEMQLVEDSHMAQDRSMFIECTSFGALHAIECEVETISTEVDGMNAMSSKTRMLNEADLEVTQDVLVAHRVDTTSGVIDSAISVLDEIEATFKAKESQTLTQAAIEDTQDVSMTCAMEPSMGYRILATQDVQKVEAVMMLGEEEEKDTITDPNFSKVKVKAGSKLTMDLHAWTVMEEAPFIPPQAQETDSDASLGEVKEIVATMEAKESESVVVVNAMLEKPQEVDSAMEELCSTKSTVVEGKFTQDASDTVMPESSRKDTCLESTHMLEEAEIMLVHEDTKYDTTDAMFEDVVSTIEGKSERDLQGKLDSEFFNEGAPSILMHSSEQELGLSLEEETKLGACLIKNGSVTTSASDTKLFEVDRIDATLSKYTSTTSAEGEFDQDGLRMTVVESSGKDKSTDSSDLMEEVEITSSQNEENYNATKAKYEEAVLADEEQMVKDPTVVIDSEFVADNLLASSDATTDELDVTLEDITEIGAMTELGCSHILIPQDGLIEVEDAPFEGNTSLITQNVLQSKQMSTVGVVEEKHFLNMATKDDATLPTEREVVEDWHMAQEGNMFIASTCFGNLRAPECEVETVSTEVDGLNALSSDTCMLNDVDLEVNQDVMATQTVDTTHGVIDSAICKLDETEATFMAEKSQTLTQAAVEDTQVVAVTCVVEPSIEYPILATHDVLDVEAVKMLGREEENDTTTDPNFTKVNVEARCKAGLDLHAWTVMEEDPFVPPQAQETHSHASLGEVEEIVATMEAKESESVVVVGAMLDQRQEVDSALVELCSTKSTVVEEKFTHDASDTVVPKSSMKDTCFEYSHLLEEKELKLVCEDTKHDTMEAVFEDVVSTVEDKPERDLQGNQDGKFVNESAPLVLTHSLEKKLGPTLEKETELRACLVKNDSVTTSATNIELFEVDRIDATLVECIATTSAEGEFDQDGLEVIVVESDSKEKSMDTSNVMEEAEIVSSQNDENYNAMKAKYEEALHVEEEKMVKDPTVAVDSEFVADNLLASLDTTKDEKDVSLEDDIEIVAMMEQGCSHVLIPQDVLIKVEDAPIEGSTSLTTLNFLQTKEMSAHSEVQEKHFLNVATKDNATLPTEMEVVEDWHKAQEGNKFIERTSFGSLRAPECVVENISTKVDGINAMSSDTCTMNEADLEVTQDVLAADRVDTTSGVIDSAIRELDEVEATFKAEESQTMTEATTEDTQVVSVTCAMEPSMVYPILANHDVLEAEAVTMLGEEEEKGTITDPNFTKVNVEAGSKVASGLHAWTVMEEAPFIPPNAQETDSDASPGEVEEIVATIEAKESESVVVVGAMLDQRQEVDSALVELCSTKSTVVEEKFTHDASDIVVPESSTKDTCFESSHLLEETELKLVCEDRKYDTKEAMFEDVVSTVEDKPERDLQGNQDGEFVNEGAPLVLMQSSEMKLGPTLEKETELGACLVKNDSVTTSATNIELFEVDRIDATLVECIATTSVEGEFDQDGLEVTVVESDSKDKSMDSSNVMEEAEIVSSQKDDNYNAMKAKYEEALHVEEEEMVRDPTIAVDSKFVADNLLASSDTTKDEMDVSLEDDTEIAAMMEQGCSHVLIPQDVLKKLEDAPIQGSTSLTTQNFQQSKEMSAHGEVEEKHFLNVATKDDATLPTEMEVVEDWHMAQEWNKFIERTSFGSLRAPECVVENISTKVDGINAMSGDTCTFNEADLEVTQDVLAADREDTTSGVIDSAICELDEVQATFKDKESQTLTKAGMEDTQVVSVTCAMEPSMVYPILAAHDVLEAEAVMMLGGEEEKDTITNPNFTKVNVEAGSKVASDLHAWTVMEEVPFIPPQAQETDSDVSLGKVEEIVATGEAKESESAVVIGAMLDQRQEVHSALVELCSTKSTVVEDKFTHDASDTVVPESSTKDTCFESSHLLEETELKLVREDTKYDTMDAMFEDVVSTVEDKPERDLQGNQDGEFLNESAPLVLTHSSDMELGLTVEKETELGACLVKNDCVTTSATNIELFEVDRIDATLVECIAATSVEGEFDQDGLEVIVVESGSKDKSMDSSNVMEEAEIVSSRNDENSNAMKAMYEDALHVEEEKMVKDPTVAVDSEFVGDNLLASLDTMKDEMDVSLEDDTEIAAMMEQGCSHVLIPQDVLKKLEDAPIQGSTSLTTQNFQQSKEMSAHGEVEEKHFLNVATKDDATLPTEMEEVEDWHMAQEGNKFIERTSFGSLRALECVEENISTEVDRTNAMSSDSCTLNEADLEVTQDVQAADRVDTTSGVIDSAIRELDEVEATFKAEESQTMIQAAMEDTQVVSVTCAMEPSMVYPIMATHDVLEAEAVMMLGGEEEKDTITDPNFTKVNVEAVSKVASDLHALTVMEEAPFIPPQAQETDSDASLGEVEEIVATMEAKESESVVVVGAKLDQRQEVDSALEELCSHKSTVVEEKFTHDASDTVVPESSTKDTCFESSHLLEETELKLVREDTKYDTMEVVLEDVVSTVEDKPERDLQGNQDGEFVNKGAPLVLTHPSEMELGPTLEMETELRACLVKTDSMTTSATNTEWFEVERIDATLVECIAATSVEGEFDQDGLEVTMVESGSKDKSMDSSNVMEEAEIVSSQNDENDNAMKAKYEEALLVKEEKMVKDPTVAVDSEFVADNMLASSDTTKDELDVSLEDVTEIAAMMEQGCSHVLIPQDGLIKVEDAPIEGSTSLTTQNFLQSKEMSAHGEVEEKHFLNVVTKDDATLPTEMEVVEDWHMAQEGNKFIEHTSFGSLRAPECVVENISTEVDGINAMSSDTCKMNEADLEVNQDVLAAHKVDTLSGVIDSAIRELDEVEATFKAMESKTLTQAAVEDTQVVSVTCAMEPSKGYPILATHDVLEVEAVMMLGGEEEKDTSTDPNFSMANVEAGSKATLDLQAWTVLEEAPFDPPQAQETDSHASLGEVQEIVATMEAKEGESVAVVGAMLDQRQEVDSALVELCSTKSTVVEEKFTHDASDTVVPESSAKDTCFESSDLLEETELKLVREDTKYDTMEEVFEDVVSTVEDKPERDLQGNQDDEFVNEGAPLVLTHSSEMELSPTLEKETELGACLVKNDSATTSATNNELFEVDRIDATLVECIVTTSAEGEFDQDGLEVTVVESGSKDKSMDSSNVVEEAEIISSQNDKNYNAMKAKYEEALLIEEEKMEKDPAVAVDSEFVVDNLLASSNTRKDELDVSLEDVTEIATMMEQGCSHVLIPQDGLIKVEDAPIEGSTSLTTQNFLQSKEMPAHGEVEEKHFLNVATKDEAILQTEMEVVENWHMAQEGNKFIERTSFGSLRALECVVENISTEVDGINAMSSYTCTLNEADLEVTQDVLATDRVDTTSGVIDSAIRELDEVEATFKAEESQTWTQAAMEDTQVVSLTCALEPSMVYPILATHDVLEVEAVMMLGGEEEKDTITDPNFTKVNVEAGSKVASDLHAWTVMEEAPFIPPQAQETDSDALLGEVEEIVATMETTESESIVVAAAMLDQSQEVDSTLVELCSTKSTVVEGKFTQDASDTVVQESSRKDTCFESSHMLEEAELMLVHEDTKYDTIEAVFEDVVPIVQDRPERDLQGKLDSKFVIEGAPSVLMHLSEMELGPTIKEDPELRACLVKNDGVTLGVDMLLQNDDPQMATEAKEMLSAERGLIKYWRTAPEPKDIEVMTEVEQELAQVQLQKLQGELGKEFTSLVSHDVSEGKVEGVLVKDDYNNVCQEGKDTEAVTTKVSFANDGQASPAGRLGNKGALIVPLDMLEGEVDPAFYMEIQKDASIQEKDGNEDMTIDWDLVKDEKTAQDVELGMIGICLASTEVPGGEVNAAINEEAEKGEVNASVTDNLLAHELAPQNKTMDGDTNEMNVVGEVVGSNKEQPLSFDVIADGNTANDDIVSVSYNDEICDDSGKIAEEDDRVSFDERPAQVAILDSSDVSKQKDTEDNDNNDDGDEEGLCSDVLASHLKPATSTSLGGNITVTSQDTSIFSVDRAADLGSSDPSLRPNATLPPSGLSIPFPSELETTPNPIEVMTEDEKKLHEKLELIRVKFLHLLCRMGATPEESVAAQVLYGPSLAEGIHHGRASSLENAWNKVLQQEAQNREDLSFSCNMLVLGKTGVGKSATINSIFGEEKSKTDAFDASTTNVREISGSLDGIQVHIIDTPGLRTNVTDQGWNKKILSAVKSYTKKCSPDMILYVDRLDSWSRDDDLPLLRTITATLGTSIWLNAIVALTHAASAPPDSSSGDPVAYETLIAHRSHIIQQSIRQAASDMRLMNPVALVENHPYCQRNRQGQMVLPNGQAWRNQLLLLCYSTKTLFEANSLLKLEDPSPREQSGFGFRSLPLPFLLSSLLQPRSHPKLSADHGGDKEDSDVDLDDYSDICDDEDEYDRLPPFSPLTKAQLHKLTKDQKNEYLDEYNHRVKLLQKKQWKGRLQRLKEMKKRGKAEQDSYGYSNMAGENDLGHPPENVAVPLPDMVLPPSFDSDDPTYQYRFLEPESTIISRPVLNAHAWDHDCGFDGVSLDGTLAIASKFPAAFSVELTKDKKELTIHLDSSISGRHGENTSSLAGFDVQTVRRELAYVLRGETTFKNIKKNKTTGGFSVTFLGNTMATGVKVEDQLSVGKSLSLVASTGAMRAQGDTAYGANLEARLKDKDYPINQFMLVLGLSLMKWRGDLALGANIQSHFSVGRGSKMALHIGLNNKLSGQINVKMSTSEQVQMALLGLVPLAASIYKWFRPAEA